MTTSALLRAGRVLEPAKITSSMSTARNDLCDVSPITQRSASTRFDLPQPFGPTTPVRPGSIRKSVGSTKDLKPSRRSRVSFMLTLYGSRDDVLPEQWISTSDSATERQPCTRKSCVVPGRLARQKQT